MPTGPGHSIEIFDYTLFLDVSVKVFFFFLDEIKLYWETLSKADYPP